MSCGVLPAPTRFSLPLLDGCKFCRNFLIALVLSVWKSIPKKAQVRILLKFQLTSIPNDTHFVGIGVWNGFHDTYKLSVWNVETIEKIQQLNEMARLPNYMFAAKNSNNHILNTQSSITHVYQQYFFIHYEFITATASCCRAVMFIQTVW